MEKQDNRLVSGKIAPVLLEFALPFMLASFLQSVYGAVDLFVVGRYTGSAAVSAVSIGSQLMQIATFLIQGICMGGTVLIGQRVGEKNWLGAADAVGNQCVLFAGLAFVLTPVMLLVNRLLVSLMQTPAEAVEDARSYLFICSIGFLFITGYNAISGIYRGLGDSKTPVYFLAIAAIINTLGLVASAAVGVAEKFMGFAFIPSSAFSSAVATMVAQNVGAGQRKRAVDSMKYGIGFSLICGVLICLVCQLVPDGLIGIFSKDEKVIRAGAQYIRTYSVDCILVSFVFCMNAYFNGNGQALFCFAHSIAATFLIRIPVTWIMSRISTESLLPMGLAAPAASLFSVAVCAIFFWKFN